jgi:hypothetical protein
MLIDRYMQCALLPLSVLLALLPEICVILARHFLLALLPEICVILAWHLWLMPTVLAIQEAEIRRIMVESQSRFLKT